MNPPTGESIEARTRIKRDGLSIYKRYEGDGQSYYHNAYVNGKEVKHKLAEGIGESFLLARKIRLAITKGTYSMFEEAKAKNANTWTIGDLEPLFKTAPMRADHRARRDTWCTTMNILRQLEPGLPDPRKHRLDVLKDLTFRWHTHTLALANAQKTQTDKGTKLRTANSMLGHIRSLFHPSVQDHYKRTAQIESPLFNEVYTGCAIHRHKNVPHKSIEVPNDDIIGETLKSWHRLQDRNVFLAVGLILSFGLRAGEVAQARWNWLTIRRDEPYIDTQNDKEAHFKNRSGRAEIPGVDPFHDQFISRARAEGWIQHKDKFIIEGNDTERTGKCFRRVSAWMRLMGWKTQKTNHALRDYIGSQLTMKYGPHQAQAWCRHSNVETTEEHYSSFVNKAGTINKELISARWAKIEPMFQPSVMRETAAA